MSAVTTTAMNTEKADVMKSKKLCGWVSACEKMPEYGHYIAAYYNPSNSNKKLYVIVVWRGRGGWYWDNAETLKAEDETLKITHWMPMPEPPSVVGGLCNNLKNCKI